MPLEILEQGAEVEEDLHPSEVLSEAGTLSHRERVDSIVADVLAVRLKTRNRLH